MTLTETKTDTEIVTVTVIKTVNEVPGNSD